MTYDGVFIGTKLCKHLKNPPIFSGYPLRLTDQGTRDPVGGGGPRPHGPRGVRLLQRRALCQVRSFLSSF